MVQSLSCKKSRFLFSENTHFHSPCSKQRRAAARASESESLAWPKKFVSTESSTSHRADAKVSPCATVAGSVAKRLHLEGVQAKTMIHSFPVDFSRWAPNSAALCCCLGRRLNLLCRHKCRQLTKMCKAFRSTQTAAPLPSHMASDTLLMEAIADTKPKIIRRHIL